MKRFMLLPRPAAFVLAVAVAALAATAGAAPSAAKKKQLTESVWVSRTMARMTLREKVGQLFVVNGYGQSVRDPDPQMVALNQQYYGVDNIAQLIQKYHPGGIIYFNWTNNLQSPAQIVALSNGIQRAARAARPRVPMIINTDQEQGEVLRIGPPATVFPGNMALGATGDVGLAREAARVTGLELRAMGINVDNAPVVDVNVNPLNLADGIRSYGDRPDLVSDFAAAQVRGYQTRQATIGVGATTKHFPGLGDVEVNSDTGVAVSEQTLAQIRKTNFPPFRAAIKAGLDIVMAGHIVFPNVEQIHGPTSLSPFVVNGLLRRELHYKGVVTTDALDAAALNAFTPAQVALRAIRAGNDQLLEIAQTPGDTPPADLVPAYNAVLRAVRTHAISRRRLDQSVRRILRLKWRLGLVKHALTDPARVQQVVGTPEHLALAEDASNRSITLLKNSAHVLPLAPNSGKKALVTGFGQTTTATIAADISARGLVATPLDTGFAPTQAMISQAVAAANASDLLVVTTFYAPAGSGQIPLVEALLATGKPVVVVPVGSPYDVAYFPSATTFITGYDYQPVSHAALVRAMFGEIDTTGKLPVTVTEPPPSTKVLYPFGYGLSVRS
jgi:beta-N-acetylhexosaminidase